jgi:hypothetical protein
MKNNERSSTAQSGGRKFRNDIIFTAGLLCAVMLAGLCIYFIPSWLHASDALLVEVKVDGQVWGTYRLDQDLTVDIRTGENGQNLNRLVIKDGRAYVEQASCPDGICASHRPIGRVGQSIVCLPNEVVIAIKAQKAQDGPDVVV